MHVAAARAVLNLRFAWRRSVRRASGCSGTMSLVAGKRAAAVRAVNELVKV